MNQAVKTTLLLLCLTSWGSSLFAQTWVELLEDPEVNFNQVQQAFESQWGNRPYERGKGWKQYKRWEFFMEDRSFPHGKRPRPNKAWEEHLAFKINIAKAKIGAAAPPIGSPLAQIIGAIKRAGTPEMAVSIVPPPTPIIQMSFMQVPLLVASGKAQMAASLGAA